MASRRDRALTEILLLLVACGIVAFGSLLTVAGTMVDRPWLRAAGGALTFVALLVAQQSGRRHPR